jgi:hypothetical protein
MLDRYPYIVTEYTNYGQQQDLLFEAEYDHIELKSTYVRIVTKRDL